MLTLLQGLPIRRSIIPESGGGEGRILITSRISAKVDSFFLVISENVKECQIVLVKRQLLKIVFFIFHFTTKSGRHMKSASKTEAWDPFVFALG